MIENNFVFADLSTYDPRIAKDFYSSVFDWRFVDAGDGYWIARRDRLDICGLYETPQKYKAMNMPPFWMSYIRAENVVSLAERARGLGGIVEFVDPHQTIGKIALIRDPLGAGFTVYEGALLNSRFDNEANALVWNELFVSDFARVEAFYAGIFRWTFTNTRDGRRLILNSAKMAVGAVQEIDNSIKGEKEYWSVYFGVPEVSETKAKILANGGSLIYEDASTTVVADPGGAFFHLAPLAAVGPEGPQVDRPRSN